MMKNRTLNELRQTRDAVYVPPRTYEERMEERKVSEGFLIMDAEGTPQVTCDDIACIVEARPMLNPSELKAHFEKGEKSFEIPGGEVIRTITRRKRPA
jgi:hypothetical protein